MAILVLMELVAVALLLWFLFSQVIIPIVRGRKVFPFWREKKIELENEIVETQELLREQNLEKELAALRKQLEAKAEQVKKDGE
jgi:uncharacterized protein YlxW (UPF0749 family)